MRVFRMSNSRGYALANGMNIPSRLGCFLFRRMRIFLFLATSLAVLAASRLHNSLPLRSSAESQPLSSTLHIQPHVRLSYAARPRVFVSFLELRVFVRVTLSRLRLLNLQYETTVCARIYRLWGPSARTCISLMDDKRVKVHRQLVKPAADEFATNVNQFAGLNSVLSVSSSQRGPFFALFFVHPFESRANCNRGICIGARPWIRLARLRQAPRPSHAAEFLKSDKRLHSWFGAAQGHIFQICVLLWFRYPLGPAEDSLSCKPAFGLVP